MKVFLKCCAVLIALLTGSECYARGAAANIMNSFGYQRRLQESRGYVPNRSGTLHATQPSPDYHPPKRRHRH
jgi:hypothetical protein